VQLDLVDRRRHPGLLDEAVEMVGLEVRHADRADQPLLLEVDERLPRLDVQVLRRNGPVDEVEIDEIELEPVEAGPERLLCVLITVVVVEALRRDEDVVAVEAGGAERLADLRLVLVGGRRVDVAVADLERAGDGLGGLVGRHLEDAEAELGDLHAVAERDVGNLAG
jgi:hypothetical protein